MSFNASNCPPCTIPGCDRPGVIGEAVVRPDGKSCRYVQRCHAHVPPAALDRLDPSDPANHDFIEDCRRAKQEERACRD